MNEFEQFIRRKQLLNCDLCIVGVSGGPDSICLLDLLVSLCKKNGKNGIDESFPKIVVAHIHHGLRGKDADADLECVKEYCKKNKLVLHVKKADILLVSQHEKMGIEHAGRKVRHAFFEEIADQYALEYSVIRIALAHHKEDKAETMMMNLFRGSGLDGLCAMPEQSGKIIRPLLFATKSQIFSYLNEHNVQFRCDQSNMSDEYTRNIWRNKVFPLLESVAMKDPVNALVELSALVEKDKDYIDRQVNEIFDKHVVIVKNDCHGLFCEVIYNQHIAIATRLVRKLFEHTFSDKINLSADQVNSILSGVKAGKSNMLFSLCDGRTARIDANYLYYESAANRIASSGVSTLDFMGHRLFLFMDNKTLWSMSDEDVEQMLSSETYSKTFSIDGLRFHIEHIEKPSQVVYNNQAWYCPASILKGLTIRTPLPGDRVSRAGKKGSKLLRRYLTDCKIPSDVRSRLVIFAHQQSVLWIPGIIHSVGFVSESSFNRYTENQNNTRQSPCGKMQILKIEINDI